MLKCSTRSGFSRMLTIFFINKQVDKKLQQCILEIFVQIKAVKLHTKMSFHCGGGARKISVKITR